MNLKNKKVKAKCIIINVIILIIICIFIAKATFDIFSIKTYYAIDITDKNKDKVIELFNQEKENIFYTEIYCDSMYKIEYYNVFPDSTNYVMYCKDEDDIEFGIDKVDKDMLATYIYENGYIEKR